MYAVGLVAVVMQNWVLFMAASTGVGTSEQPSHPSNGGLTPKFSVDCDPITEPAPPFSFASSFTFGFSCRFSYQLNKQLVFSKGICCSKPFGISGNKVRTASVWIGASLFHVNPRVSAACDLSVMRRRFVDRWKNPSRGIPLCMAF